MTPRPHVLVVDDEAGIRESLSSILADEGYNVDLGRFRGRSPRSSGRRRYRSRAPRRLAARHRRAGSAEPIAGFTASSPAVIMISGHGTIETAVRANKNSARFDFIEKPLSLEKNNCNWCATPSSSAACRKKISCCAASLGHRYQVIGESVPMKALRQQIAVTQPQPMAGVLIFGEKRHGQRARRSLASRGQPPQQGIVCRSKLRRDSRRLDRIGTVSAT